jgi:hypothetical protein
MEAATVVSASGATHTRCLCDCVSKWHGSARLCNFDRMAAPAPSVCDRVLDIARRTRPTGGLSSYFRSTERAITRISHHAHRCGNQLGSDIHGVAARKPICGRLCRSTSNRFSRVRSRVDTVSVEISRTQGRRLVISLPPAATALVSLPGSARRRSLRGIYLHLAAT